MATPDQPQLEDWVTVDQAYLDSQRATLSPSEILGYFNGAIPTWRHALSDSIPRRDVVNDLVHDFTAGNEAAGKPVVRLVTGAGGEGKSTVLRHVLSELVLSPDTAWTALWPAVPNPPLSVDQVMSLPEAPGPWLIASDDAERLAKTCVSTIQQVWEVGRKDVHFLFAARDTDWRALDAHKERWPQWSDFKEITLRGLTIAEAEAIVTKWEALEDAGLGALTAVPAHMRARKLKEVAESEAAREEGSFFGALLQLRFGKALSDHLRDILYRLDEREGVGSESLLHAFLLVAVPHALNIRSLTPNVLARALKSNEALVREHVIVPLGEEAAANIDGRFVLARHRKVAETAVGIAEDEMGKSLGVYYESLALANYHVGRVEGERLPGFNDFNFLSRTLREEVGEGEHARRVAASLCQKEPHNRYYVAELGACYGSVKQYALDAYLCAASLRDIPAEADPSNDSAKIALAGAGVAFRSLHEEDGDANWLSGTCACGRLGLSLTLDGTARSYFRGYCDYAEARGLELTDPSGAFEQWKKAVQVAWSRLEAAPPAHVPEYYAMSFNGLAGLLGVS